MIFRYVKNDAPWSGIECTCAGSGWIGNYGGRIEVIRKEGAISEKIEIESTAQSCYTISSRAVFFYGTGSPFAAQTSYNREVKYNE